MTTADYTFSQPKYRQQFRDTYDTTEMYFWLSGEHDKFDLIDGKGWPMSGQCNDVAYVVPEGIN